MVEAYKAVFDPPARVDCRRPRAQESRETNDALGGVAFDNEKKRRAEALEHGRTIKLARSAHAYMRGNTIRFYEWLAGMEAQRLPSGPPVWICGAFHLGNLGPLASRDGKVDVQIRDLDQTVIGNPAHDLIRWACPSRARLGDRTCQE